MAGADASNYSFAGFTSAANYTINPLVLTGAAIAPVSTTYGTVAAPGAVTFGNIIGADVVTSTASIVSPTYSSSGNLNAGSYTQTASAITGADAANYSFAGFTSAANYTVNPYAVSMTGSRAYDSTTTVDASIFALGPLVGTETLTLSGAGSVNSANAGTYSVASGTLSLTGLTLGNGTNGGLASNYTFTGGTQSVTIGTAALAVVTADNASKTYGTIYNLGTTAFTVTGLQGSDNISDVTLTSTGAASTANAGTYAIVPSNAVFSVGSPSNYTISYVNGTLTVNPAVLTATIIGTPTKVYNGTTAATLAAGNYAISGFMTGEGATVTQTAGTYNSKDVLTATTVNVTLAPADFTATGTTLLSNYILPTAATGAGTITPLALTGAAIAASSSIYGSVLTPGAVSFGNVIGADIVTAAASVNTGATSSSGNFIVGSYTQTAGTTLGGADAANYSFAGFTSAANYAINPLALTVSGITVNTKVYDGTTSATLNLGSVSFGGLITGDVVSIATGSISGSFVDKNAGSNKTVTLTGVALSDVDAGNYTVAGVGGVTGNITPLALTGAAIAPVSTTYGTVAAPGAVTFGNIIGADVVTSTASIVSPTYSSSGNLNAGSYTQTASTTLGGADASNYSFAGFTSAANYTINPLVLTGAAIAAVSTTYGTVAATGAVTFGNIIGADVVTSTASIVSPTYSSSGNLNAGSYTQTASTTLGGADASNYSFAGFTSAANYTVSQLALSGAAIAASSSIYGSVLTPGAVSFGNIVSGDIVTGTASVNTGATSSSGNFIVGSYTQTAGTTLGGADAGNYSFAGFTSAANYTINPLVLTGAAITAVNTTYGTPAATGAVTFGNIIGADVVTSTSSIDSPTYSTSGNLNAGSYTQTASTTLGGADAGNYSFAGFTSAANYTINPLVLSGAAIAAVNTTYGTPAATGAVTFGNIIGADVVTSTASIDSPTYSTSGNLNAGSYTQTASAITGADAANYSFAGFTSAANYTVSQLALTGAAIAASSSIYGSALTPGAVSFGNIVSGDSVTGAASVNTGATSSSGNFIVGSYTQTAGTTLGGADAGNYSFAGFTSAANYTINPLVLTGAAITAVNTTYGTPAATGAVSFGNIIGADVVTSTSSIDSPTYSTSGNLNAGGYTQTASAITGADAANYSFAGFTSAANYTVNPFAVSMTGTRVYDGTVNADAGIFTLGPLVGTETLTLSGTGTVPSKDVGTYPVTLGTLALGDGSNGGVASNYTFAGGTQTVTIDPAPLYVAIVGNPTKVYDGTTGATLSSANYALTGFVSGEGGTVNTGTVGTYYTDVTLTTPSKDVLTATTVGATLAPTDFTANAGTLLSNYILPTAATGPGQITPYVVSMSGSRQYNGTTNVAASIFTTPPGTMGTLVGTETLTVSGSGTVTSKNVGTYSTALGTLALGTLALGDGTNGGLASNYTLIGGSQTVTITPYVVKLYGSRSYDTTATVNASAFGTVYGVNVGGITETLTLTGSGSMADKNAGPGKPVALGTLALSDGVDLGPTYSWLAPGLASNYTLVGSTPKITILKVPISITGRCRQWKRFMTAPPPPH